MSVIAIDLGGTKVSGAVFRETGELVHREVRPVDGVGEAMGAGVAALMRGLAARAADAGDPADSVGVAVPGIFRSGTGRVWAPNIGGWEDYPLLAELSAAAPEVEVGIDSDRACYILGESWRGAARGARDAVFIAVGTGIGAGVLVDGRVLRGHGDVAGSMGWLAIGPPYREEYGACGALEYHAAGPGIARAARRLVAGDRSYRGPLRRADGAAPTTADVFEAHEAGDAVAARVLDRAVALWGMALANVVSLLDPEVVVFGGGVFGPGVRLLDRVRAEALRWGQPISMARVRVEASRLGADAGLYGAARLALGSGATGAHGGG